MKVYDKVLSAFAGCQGVAILCQEIVCTCWTFFV